MAWDLRPIRATALFIARFGAAGYATKRDLSALARVAFFALIGQILFGIVMIFVRIPNGDLIYDIIGLVIFAGFTMFDFQRLRRSRDIRSARRLSVRSRPAGFGAGFGVGCGNGGGKAV